MSSVFRSDKFAHRTLNSFDHHNEWIAKMDDLAIAQAFAFRKGRKFFGKMCPGTFRIGRIYLLRPPDLFKTIRRLLQYPVPCGRDYKREFQPPRECYPPLV